MSKIHIDYLRAFKTNGEVSSIDFAKNLTIISGPSDTGKTYIFKAIDYLLGANTLPFSKSTPYSKVGTKISTDFGYIVVERDFTKENKNNVTICDSNVDGIESNQIINVEKYRSDVLNRLLGITQKVKIPKNQSGEYQTLSWGIVKSAFMYMEKRMQSEASILIQEDRYSKTAFLSSLLYILYQQDFTQYLSEESKTIMNAKKKAVVEYIDKTRMKANKERRERIAELKKAFDPDTPLEKQIDFLNSEYNRIDEITQNYVSELSNIKKQMTEILSKINETDLTIKNFKSLKEQYVADINRLTSIVDGEVKVKGSLVGQNHICPFCNHELEEVETSYISASKTELQRILEYMQGLDDSIKEAEDRRTGLQNEYNVLLGRKKDLSHQLDDEFKPKKKELLDLINKHNELLKLQFEDELLNSQETILQSEKEEVIKEYTNTINYKPMELFPSSFEDDLSRYFFDILEEINYKPLESVTFNKASFDIVLNGEAKSTRGKGYSAFLNTILILSFRKYMNETAVINPHFYFIDSPLSGLEISEDDVNNADDIRKGLFDYLANNYENDQIIIIENTKKHELPELQNNLDENIKIYKFTGSDKAQGRYGFLDGVHKK